MFWHTTSRSASRERQKEQQNDENENLGKRNKLSVVGFLFEYYETLLFTDKELNNILRGGNSNNTTGYEKTNGTGSWILNYVFLPAG